MKKKSVSKQRARKFVGKKVYAVQKNGKVVTGKLVKVSGNTLYISASNPKSRKSGKQVHTKCIIALALLGIVAIGAFAFGATAFGGGFSGHGSGCGCSSCNNGGYNGNYGSYGFW